jgi:hypothetical protein
VHLAQNHNKPVEKQSISHRPREPGTAAEPRKPKSQGSGNSVFMENISDDLLSVPGTGTGDAFTS